MGSSCSRNPVIVPTGSDIVIPGFEGKIITPNHPKLYEKSREQYATSSYLPIEMSPFAIAYVKADKDKDIGLILKFAAATGKKIVIRSGGCQYSGLSSGDAGHIQVDMSDYNNIWVEDDIATIEPCNQLGKVGALLHNHGVIFPFGDCHCVNIGGHVQTGGFGNLLRGFGLCLDRVISFDIILADGHKRTIVKPKDDEKYDVHNPVQPNLNHDLYWAVLGGNPGSFGIITKYNFKCIKDVDHPHSAGVSVTYLYCYEVLTAMLLEYEKLTQTIDTIPTDYDFMITVASVPNMPGFGGIIFEGTYSNIDGKNSYNPDYFKPFLDIPGAIKQHTTFNGKRPLSEMMLEFILLKNKNREYDFPYKKSLRGATKPWKKGFVKSYCDRVHSLIVDDGLNSKFKFISQVQLGGGSIYLNDPKSTRTSIANRNIIIGFTFDIFYDDCLPWNKNAEEEAQKIQDECEKEWITNKLFSDEDIRLTWGTFGNTDINQVWSYYYNPNASQRYNTLKRIKRDVDRNNLFHNRFTIPLQ